MKSSSIIRHHFDEESTGNAANTGSMVLSREWKRKVILNNGNCKGRTGAEKDWLEQDGPGIKPKDYLNKFSGGLCTNVLI